MLTVLDKETTVTDKGKKPGSVGINNTYLNNGVNAEAIGIALTSVFKSERLFKLINSLTTNIVKAKYSSLMLIEGETLRIKYSNHLPEYIEKECREKLGNVIQGLRKRTTQDIRVNLLCLCP
jgi:hypothetical protein